MPADFKTFKFNKSLECLAAPPKGAPLAGKLIVVTERSLDAAGNHRAFLLDGDKVERFSVKRSGGFRRQRLCRSCRRTICCCSSAAIRRLRGVAMHIRRIPLPSLKEGAVVDGPALIDGRHGLSDRQHGRHRRASHARGRNGADARVGRQFFGDTAQSAAAIYVGGEWIVPGYPFIARRRVRPEVAGR